MFHRQKLIYAGLHCLHLMNVTHYHYDCDCQGLEYQNCCYFELELHVITSVTKNFITIVTSLTVKVPYSYIADLQISKSPIGPTKKSGEAL